MPSISWMLTTRRVPSGGAAVTPWVPLFAVLGLVGWVLLRRTIRPRTVDRV
jgi:hypothetical protein